MLVVELVSMFVCFEYRNGSMSICSGCPKSSEGSGHWCSHPLASGCPNLPLETGLYEESRVDSLSEAIYQFFVVH